MKSSWLRSRFGHNDEHNFPHLQIGRSGATLEAQISLNIAQQNVNSNDTIYKIAQGRYDLGKIPENDLLQLELNLMNSRQSVAQAELNLETASLRLRSFLSLGENQNRFQGPVRPST